MIKYDDFYRYDREQFCKKVLENSEAFVVYFEHSGDYMAIDKEIRGKEYSLGGLYNRSTRGDFKRCKKAFEKYSAKTMQVLRG